MESRRQSPQDIAPQVGHWTHARCAGTTVSHRGHVQVGGIKASHTLNHDGAGHADPFTPRGALSRAPSPRRAGHPVVVQVKERGRDGLALPKTRATEETRGLATTRGGVLDRARLGVVSPLDRTTRLLEAPA